MSSAMDALSPPTNPVSPYNALVDLPVLLFVAHQVAVAIAKTPTVASYFTERPFLSRPEMAASYKASVHAGKITLVKRQTWSSYFSKQFQAVSSNFFDVLRAR